MMASSYAAVILLIFSLLYIVEIDSQTGQGPTTMMPTTESPSTRKLPSTHRATTTESGATTMIPTTESPSTRRLPSTRRATTTESGPTTMLPTTESPSTRRLPSTPRATTTESGPTTMMPTTESPSTEKLPSTPRATTESGPTTMMPTTESPSTRRLPSTPRATTTESGATTMMPTTESPSTRKLPSTPRATTTESGPTTMMPTTESPSTRKLPSTPRATTTESGPPVLTTEPSSTTESVTTIGQGPPVVTTEPSTTTESLTTTGQATTRNEVTQPVSTTRVSSARVTTPHIVTETVTEIETETVTEDLTEELTTSSSTTQEYSTTEEAVTQTQSTSVRPTTTRAVTTEGLTTPASPTQAHEGDLRLFGGTDHYSGRVEIYHESQWGTICDHGWSYYDAIVACRQLGFTGTSTARCCAAYGQGTTPILLMHLYCDRTEERLSDCRSSDGWGPHLYHCDHYEDAGMICSGATNNVRLVANGTQEGVVEIFVNSRWGSICFDNWDMLDADVLCRQMRYTDAEMIYNTSISASSLQEIPVMGSVACSGSEDYLAECSHARWGYFWDHPTESYGTCDNGIAAVKCRLIFGPDQIRLIGGGSNEGRVEVNFDGTWGSICYNNWDIRDGEVACRQMGFPGVVNVTTGSSYGPGSGRIWLDDLDCVGNENNLAECDHDGWLETRQCMQPELAGVICLRTLDGDIRLVGGTSDTHSDGRLEIFHNGQWGSVCNDGWSDVDTLIACRHLGYNSVGSAVLAPDSALGAWFSNVSCTGDENHFGECSFNYWNETSQCNNGNYVALNCSGASNKLRLVDGLTNRDGNVEIYHNGRWGSICPNDWGINEVRVVCKYFGFSGEGEVLNRVISPESSSGPTWLGGLNCSGSESNLAECPHPGWEKNGCDYAEQAGVLCHVAREGDLRLLDNSLQHDDFTTIVTRGIVEVYHRGAWGSICGRGWDDFDGGVVCRQLGFTRLIETGTGHLANSATPEPDSIRLVGGNNANEGRVEVYYNGIWGTVCDDSWDTDDAMVICRQLGLPHRNAQASRSAFYGQGSGTIWLDNVDCLGSENRIDECRHNGWGSHNCGHSEDAGVACVGGIADDSNVPDSGERNVEFVLADVDCTGSESSILKCGLNGWRVDDCDSTQPVYVVCSEIDVTPPVIYTCPRDINVTVKVGSMSKPVF
ncbi:scavenger receptor cysteine-rich domain superfamily protein-like [Amphiura filiformis]|uniref:scavenger receptor cysteine-rich domain superfamily protein-like n=1 Tax=Amphiura filiformis TaxID=82378 RepID=UPI003B223704